MYPSLFPFFQKQSVLRFRAVLKLEVPAKPKLWVSRFVDLRSRPEQPVQYERAGGTSLPGELLDLCATTLDEKDQHDHKQNAGSNPDNRRCVQNNSSFP